MSRPQKIHKPLKLSFTEIINAVAVGSGIAKPKTTRSKGIVKAVEPMPKKT